MIWILPSALLLYLAGSLKAGRFIMREEPEWVDEPMLLGLFAMIWVVWVPAVLLGRAAIRMDKWTRRSK